MMRKGFVLVTVLMLSSVLLMITVTMVVRARTGAGFQIEGQREVAALYAAEAGVADALSRWSEDDLKSWRTDLVDVPLPDSNAYYTVRFGPTASVNNLNQATAADGPLGPGTVPPRSAYVVCTGTCGGRSRTLEVLVSRTGVTSSPAALVGRGEITMEGSVTVSGLRSMEERIETDADLISLSQADVDNLVSWNGSGEVNIEGAITSNSPTGAAISSNLAAANITGGALAQQNRESPQRVNIPKKVTKAFARPHTVPTFSGTTTTLSPGASCIANPPQYNGDLVLSGTNLYVDGDLTINGGIRGKGSIFVTGKTTFAGAATINSNDSGVALYSQGDVELKGFDGSAFLESVLSTGADGAPYSEHLQNFKTWTDRLVKVAADPNSQLPNSGTIGLPGSYGYGDPNVNVAGTLNSSPPGVISDFDALWQSIAHDASAFTDSTRWNPVRRIDQRLQTLAASDASPSLRYVADKFHSLHPDVTAGVFGSRTGHTVRLVLPRLRRALEDGSSEALLDALHDIYLVPGALTPAEKAVYLTRVVNMLREFNFDKPGMAYFQGVVYTEGDFKATDEVKILGTLLAVGDTSKIHLKNGVWVTYVPEVARQAGESLGLVGVRHWIRR